MKYLSYVAILLASSAAVSAGNSKKPKTNSATNMPPSQNGQAVAMPPQQVHDNNPAKPGKPSPSEMQKQKQDLSNELFGNIQQIMKEQQGVTKNIEAKLSVIKKFESFLKEYNASWSKTNQELLSTGSFQEIIGSFTDLRKEKIKIEKEAHAKQQKNDAIKRSMQKEIDNLKNNISQKELEIEKIQKNPKGSIATTIKTMLENWEKQAKEIEKTISQPHSEILHIDGQIKQVKNSSDLNPEQKQNTIADLELQKEKIQNSIDSANSKLEEIKRRKDITENFNKILNSY